MTTLASARRRHPSARGQTMSELPDFEGLDVTETGVTIPNAAGGLNAAMKIAPTVLHAGDVVDVVMRCTVRKINHEPVKKDDLEGEWRRVHVMSAGTATIIESDVVSAALDEQAEAQRKADDEAKGVLSLLDDNNAATDARAAELLGESPTVLNFDTARYERMSREELSAACAAAGVEPGFNRSETIAALVLATSAAPVELTPEEIAARQEVAAEVGEMTDDELDEVADWPPSGETEASGEPTDFQAAHDGLDPDQVADIEAGRSV